MKLWASCLLLAVLPTLAQQPSAKKPPEKCTVRGVVLKAGSDEPIRRATVFLWQENADKDNRSVTSDAQGRFELKDLEPGRYVLRVNRDGHLVQRLGTGSAWTSSNYLPITLTAGLKVDMVAYMVPGAVIAGRVLDAEGEPVVRAHVEAAQFFGASIQYWGESAETNDLGEYRIHSLRPGRYYVRASPSPFSERALAASGKSPAQGSERQVYVPTYYPGVPERSQAGRVEVHAGEEARADLSLLLMRAVSVRGRLLGLKDGRLDSRSTVALLRAGGSYYYGAEATARVREDGGFEIEAVVPGSYLLTAYTYSGEQRILARQRIEVSDSGVDDLLVATTLFSRSPLEGRVRVEGGSDPLPDNLRVSVVLDPPEEERDFPYFGRGPHDTAPVKPDGRFTIDNLEDGRYRIRLSAEGSARQKFADHYLKSATVTGKDVLETGLWVREGRIEGQLDLVLSSAGARIEGVVVDDAEKPAVGVLVIAVPEAKRRNLRSSYESQRTDQNGHFLLRGIRPGRYTLLAGEGEAGFVDYGDPEFLKKYEDKGVTATLQENERSSVTLRAFRLEDP